MSPTAVCNVYFILLESERRGPEKDQIGVTGEAQLQSWLS